MSTSPSGAALPAKGAPNLSPRLQPFPYAVVPSEEKGGAVPGETSSSSSPGPSPRAGEVDIEARALARGRQEGLIEARKEFDEHLTQERSNVAGALSQFAADRVAYFRKVESEVVQLSLGIARKILHREAQVDPLLLAGMVRFALETIDGATHVILQTHPQNANPWRTYLSLHMEPSEMPEVVEDASQPIDRCVLKTSLGTAQMGLDIQLKEIEQGLLDLLAARPGENP